jgi:hypothetical protein
MMRDDEIEAFAKATAPFVRKCVAEALSTSMIVSPEIAAQVAEMVRMLHEASPLTEWSEPLRSLPPRITRVERDAQGNFVPIYETQS